MRVHAMSDLHQEFAAFQPAALDVDVVVLAGDIHTLVKGVEWANDSFTCDVVYVLGNHEYYRGHLDRTLEKIRRAAAPHVHVLENESFVLNDVRFLGATSWTDFTSTGDLSVALLEAGAMNDFKLIRTESRYRRLTPNDVATRSRHSKAWLTAELERPFSGRTVVVTHHAPIREVIGDTYDGHLSASYFNNWYSLVERADIWIFGHTHQSVDMQIGSCRAVSNPLGYPGEVTGFDPLKILHI